MLSWLKKSDPAKMDDARVLPVKGDIHNRNGTMIFDNIPYVFSLKVPCRLSSLNRQENIYIFRLSYDGGLADIRNRLLWVALK
jgi:hypothetical protein